MKRLALFGVVAAVMAFGARPSAMIPAQVRVDTGMLEGVTGDVHSSVRIFKGIPFAAPPVGENRWKAPQPAAKWDGVRKADAFGAPCTAGGGGGRGRGAAPGRGGAPGAPGAAPQAAAPPQRQPPASEDCLTLNIWTSANAPNARQPVMVWIYGGGFTGGSGSMAWYDGEDLSAKGAVVVTLNYRLGALGFFAHPELAKESGRNASGNYGMMDALAALQWVKRNISNFGGDPNNVTIFGESAGAIMIGALVGSPQAKGLFNRAIAQSGAWMGLQMGRMTPGASAQANGVKALEAAGIKTIAELRSKPLNELPPLGGAGLVIDGYIIPEDLSITFANGRQNDVDVLAGSNKDENTFFGGGRGGGRGGRGGAGGGEAPAPGAAVEAYVAQAKQRYGDLADTFLKLYPVKTDADVPLMNAQAQNDEIAWNMRQFAAAQAKKGKKGYAYFFTRVPLRDGKPQPNGATHTAEISYVFNHAYSGGNPAPLEWNDVDRRLADTMSSYWVNFAAKGDPNGSGLPKWPEYKDLARDRVMVLGDTVQLEAAPMTEKNAFFNARYARLMQAGN
jgi:para-nitrobenzyl esterase